MMCEKCGKNMATTHIKQTINGTSAEWRVCGQCASSQNVQNLHDMFAKMGFNFGDLWGNLFTEFTEQSQSSLEEDGLKCSGCAKTFKEIINSGKVGCAVCYETFHDNLIPTIQRVHGNTKHTGKIPEGAGEGLKKEREIDELRRKLSQCIAQQHYEQCAEIRDQITALETELTSIDTASTVDNDQKEVVSDDGQ